MHADSGIDGLVANYGEAINALETMPIDRLGETEGGIPFGRCRVLRWHEATWRIESPGRKGFASDAVTTAIQAVARLLFRGGLVPVDGLAVWSGNGERGAVAALSHKGRRVFVDFAHSGEIAFSFRDSLGRWAGMGGMGNEWRSIVFLKSEVPTPSRDD